MLVMAHTLLCYNCLQMPMAPLLRHYDGIGIGLVPIPHTVRPVSIWRVLRTGCCRQTFARYRHDWKKKILSVRCFCTQEYINNIYRRIKTSTLIMYMYCTCSGVLRNFFFADCHIIHIVRNILWRNCCKDFASCTSST